MGERTRRGISFLNATLYGGVAGGYWAIMLEDMVAALNGLGESCTVKPPTGDEVMAFARSLEDEKTRPDYVLLFNYQPMIYINGEPTSKAGLWKYVPIKQISILLDHPLHQLGSLFEQRRYAESMPGMPPRCVGVMEAGHRRCLQSLGFDVSHCFVCPQGGPLPKPERKPLRERTIEVLFTGTINDPVGDREFCESQGIRDPLLQRRVGAITEAVIDGEDDVYEIVATGWSDTMVSAEIPAPTALAYEIDLRARNIRRYRLLNRFKDVPVHVYGFLGSNTAKLVPRGIFHEPVPFAKVLDLLDNTRMVVNDTINLRDSMLIRLFYAMARGCVAATEVNRFMTKSFKPFAEFIPMSGDVGAGMAVIEQCVRDPDSCQDMVESAVATYQAGHLWSHRLGGLVDVINRD